MTLPFVSLQELMNNSRPWLVSGLRGTGQLGAATSWWVTMGLGSCSDLYPPQRPWRSSRRAAPGARLLLRQGDECRLQTGPGRPSKPRWRQAGEKEPADSLSGVGIDLRGQMREGLSQETGAAGGGIPRTCRAHFCLHGLAAGSLPCSEDAASPLRTKPTFPAALPWTGLCSRFFTGEADVKSPQTQQVPTSSWN
ncbi:hypothetical protein HJG60_009965 [Phyllostomus discolor]|uniref:Uncharacterized protein n=1 Tax=Phyllostomus discolor TaxID=89673 RepID=A0A834BA18_9CHIR|nr:hypothetical protein HJG60_009965 [Phyllostomus discolor]